MKIKFIINMHTKILNTFILKYKKIPGSVCITWHIRFLGEINNSNFSTIIDFSTLSFVQFSIKTTFRRLDSVCPQNPVSETLSLIKKLDDG
jgi:hypothetical protein